MSSSDSQKQAGSQKQAVSQKQAGSQKQQLLQRKAFLLDRNLSRAVVPLCPSFVTSIEFDQGKEDRPVF